MSPKPKCLLLLPGDASDGTQRRKGNAIKDHLIVGTPGIFVTALKEGLNLDKLKVFVLDEADHVSTSTSTSTSIRTIISLLTIDSIVY
jgi:superfamily II DNA/RNA helicase